MTPIKYKSNVIGATTVELTSPPINNLQSYKFKVESRDNTYYIELPIKSFRRAMEKAEEIYLESKEYLS